MTAKSAKRLPRLVDDEPEDDDREHEARYLRARAVKIGNILALLKDHVHWCEHHGRDKEASEARQFAARLRSTSSRSHQRGAHHPRADAGMIDRASSGSRSHRPFASSGPAHSHLRSSHRARPRPPLIRPRSRRGRRRSSRSGSPLPPRPHPPSDLQRLRSALQARAHVARCETGNTLDPRAEVPAGERGLFQIHPVHFGWLRERLLWQPRYNSLAAFHLSRGGRDWHHWTCRP